MSYRIAYVRFTKAGSLYPVSCHRADLVRDDVVVVQMAKGGCLKLAAVDRVEFLNWNCTNTILCLRSEYVKSDNGTFQILPDPNRDRGMETLGHLGRFLVGSGWRSFKPTSKAWKRIFAKSFEKDSAAIIFRLNGIDYQIFSTPSIPDVSGECMSYSTQNGDPVRNWFYYTESDLLEHTRKFAQELEKSARDLTPYRAGLGVKKPKPVKERDDLDDIRSAINGPSGGPAYLCDDNWI